MLEVATILICAAIVVMVLLGRIRHRDDPPAWVLNPIMSLLIWVPFGVLIVGVVIFIDSITGSAAADLHGYDVAISVAIIIAVIFGGRYLSRRKNIAG